LKSAVSAGPSTYASIIKTIVDRGYVTKENKSLVPTDTGDVVSSFLEKNFPDYINDTFTASMEDNLDGIARGEKEYVKTLKEFYGPFQKEVREKSKSSEKITDLGPVSSEFKCPVCGSPMIYKLSRGGKFMSCSRFPECTGALTVDGKEIKKDEPIGNHPETQEPIYIKVGRFGPYVQLGEGGKKDGKKVKPRMASVPKTKDPETVNLEDALKYLSLPRTLGINPDTGKEIIANVGRFGPYIMQDGDFRSLKTDDVYNVSFERALEILKEPKKARFGRKKVTSEKVDK
jgi:DNA topoisomerase-1